MSGSRSDYATQLKKTPVVYSDFLDDFTPHPATGDIGRITNSQSIKQSIQNLIFTNYGERLFQPTIGSNVNRILFEPNDIIAQQDLQFHITNTLTQNEPRIILLGVTVTPDVQNDYVYVNIVFSIINSVEVQSVSVYLQRVR